VTTVRRATRADRARIVRTTARAFADDPLVGWFFEHSYAETADEFFATLFDIRVDDGEVWVTDDAVSIAEWNPPDGLRGPEEPRTERWRHAGERFTPLTIDRFRRWGELIEPLLPPQPYWYLGMLATHPDWQRQGLARAVLRPVGERADREGVPVYLETATEEDVAFYAGLGFTIRHTLDVPDGPHTWGMWREPGDPTSWQPSRPA
jgi:GNAT superfamily N-acetyltransferase